MWKQPLTALPVPMEFWVTERVLQSRRLTQTGLLPFPEFVFVARPHLV